MLPRSASVAVVSEALILLVTAFGGAAVTLLSTFAFRIRDAYSSRAAALAAVEDELKSASDKIVTALANRTLWPSALGLAGPAWRDFRGELASVLTRASWREIQSVITGLELADKWADDLRKEPPVSADAPSTERSTADREQFFVMLEKLGVRVKQQCAVPERGFIWTRSRLLIGRLAVAAAASAVIVVMVVLLTAGPVLTRTAIAHELQTQLPGATHVVCDESKADAGRYICDAAFPPCAGELSASTTPTSCGGIKEQAFDVTTQGSCFIAKLVEQREAGQPLPPKGKLAKVATIIKAICKRP
jgi:hypothetical protein